MTMYRMVRIKPEMKIWNAVYLFLPVALLEKISFFTAKMYDSWLETNVQQFSVEK